MGRAGRPTVAIELTDEERETLETTPKDATLADPVDGPAARDQPTDRQ